MLHEAQMHEDNCFLTLTYDDDHLPPNGSLVKADMQRFFKRFRARLDGRRIKFFYCGEYGDKGNRPHYHAIIFNYFPPDAVLHSYDKGNPYFISSFFSSIWSMGNHYLSSVSFDTCAYVAQYCTKKIISSYDFTRVNLVDGTWWEVENEFGHQSNGIGLSWLNKYHTDIWKKRADQDDFDFVITSDGRKLPPPRYYLEKRKELEDKSGVSWSVKARRIARADPAEQRPERLRAKEKFAMGKLRLKGRSFENEDV